MELIYVLIGVFIGSLITTILHCARRSLGTLEINYSDPEKDLYRIVLSDDLDTLAKKKRISLRIKVSQK